MQISLTHHTYIRTTSSRGYIANAYLNKQLAYEEIGASWLQNLSYAPISIKEIILNLRKEDVFREVSEEVLLCDLVEFYSFLQDCGFVKIDNVDNVGRKVITDSDSLPKELNSLFFEVTDKCNERCVHCYIPNIKKTNGISIPFELFKRIVDEFCLMGGKGVTLSGGEIGMHPYLAKLIEYCHAKHLDISLFSNCALFDKKEIEFLSKMDVSEVQVSLYSLDPDIHDSITKVSGSCKKTLDAIKIMQEFNITIKMAISAMKQNARTVVDVLKFAKENNIETSVDFAIMAREDKTTDNLDYRLSIRETEQLLQEINTFDSSYLLKYKRQIINDESDDFDFLAFLKRHVCEVGVDNLCITANGDVVPCAGWNGLVLGNVYKQSLADIWENSKELSSLRSVKEMDFPDCVNCDANNYCMRCMNRNYNENNMDIFSTPHHFCEVAHLLKKIIESNMKTIILHRFCDNSPIEIPINLSWRMQKEDEPTIVNWMSQDGEQEYTEHVRETIVQIKEKLK